MQKPLWLLKMELAIIVAVANNGVIGNKGDLPWRGKIPGDLKRFAELTLGHPCIMGRTTYESLPERFKPLPRRTNIVVSRLRSYMGEGIIVVGGVQEAYEEASKRDEIAFCIGGQKIFESMLPMTDRIYLTRIHESFVGDRYFPDFNFNQMWNEVDREDRRTEEGLEYSFVEYVRNDESS